MTLKPARLQWSDDGAIESLDYGDVYFQRKDGPLESDYVFLQGNNLESRFRNLSAGQGFHVAELGFGTGLNFLLTAALFDRLAPAGAYLTFTSIEKHPIGRKDLERIHAFWPETAALSAEMRDQYPPLIGGIHHLTLCGGRIRLMLFFDDAAAALPQLQGQFDAWYLDGFTPAKNPGMWLDHFFPLIAARTRPGGTLATFSVAGAMRRALKEKENGFEVKKIKGYGIKWSMTTAQKAGTALPAAKKNIAVLGAGIAGCSAAYALALRGHKVTVIDRQENFAQEASGNPVAIMHPKMSAAPSAAGIFHTQGFCYTRALLNHLKVSSWRESGVLQLDTELETTEHHQKIILKNGYPPDFAHYDGGLMMPVAGYFSPAEFCAALLRHPDIRKKFRQPVDTLVTLRREYDAVVIALGHSSRDFVETSWLPLQALRGQMTFVRATAASSALNKVICHRGYIAPAIDGIHCIGATFQKEERTKITLRPEDDRENVSRLQQYLPQLGITEKDIAGARAGYRTTTPDKLPLIGPCPDYPAFIEEFAPLRQGRAGPEKGTCHGNLFVTTGFGAHGMAGAPLAGELIAAMISDDPLPVAQDLLPRLLPERFILRDLKRGKI